MPTVTIQKNAKDLIIIEENHGGYLTGYCFACSASGWIDRYGYPSHVKAPGNHLQHKDNCPMNKVLNDNGSLKPVMTETKRLVFGEGLLVPSLDGSKRFTVRKYREGAHDFSKDEIIIGEFKDGLNILLRITEDTKKDAFKRLKKSKKETDKNGYYFDTEYFEDLKQYYSDLTWDTMGAVVFFELLKVNGVSIVSINEHYLL